MDTTVLLASAATVWALGYVAACAIWPFGNCARCHGTAKLRSPSGKAFRICTRCKGTGRRVRVGRRIYEALRADQRRADQADRNQGRR